MSSITVDDLVGHLEKNNGVGAKNIRIDDDDAPKDVIMNSDGSVEIVV